MRRTPHGVRGLKWFDDRGSDHRGCRTPHGVRGLKSREVGAHGLGACRTPHGVRGLKCLEMEPALDEPKSHPSRGAWIEID